MWAVRAVLIAILVIAIIAFAFNNPPDIQKVDVKLQPFLDNRVDVPLLTIVFWAFVAGVILSLVLFITTYIKLSVQIRNQRKMLKSLEQEVAILRNRPIEESADILRGIDEQAATPADMVDEGLNNV